MQERQIKHSSRIHILQLQLRPTADLVGPKCGRILTVTREEVAQYYVDIDLLRLRNGSSFIDDACL